MMPTIEDIERAREALDSLDDYARMGVGVDAIGPRKVLEDVLNQIAQCLRDAKPIACRLYNGEGGYNYTDDKETMERWANKENGWGEYLCLHSKQVKKVDYPECSGNPASCPENEGHGCCMPNPQQSHAK